MLGAQTGLGDGLAGDLAVGILPQVGVEDGVGDLVAHLICKNSKDLFKT